MKKSIIPFPMLPPWRYFARCWMAMISAKKTWPLSLALKASYPKSYRRNVAQQNPHREIEQAIQHFSSSVLLAGDEMVQSFLPLATCPRSKKVFGYLPSPQILIDPKSLYQAPSGASGSDSRHNFS